MIPIEVINLLNFIENTSNEQYYQHKLKIVELIYSFKTKDECWKGLRSSDAWILLRKEPRLLEPLKISHPEIWDTVDLLAECHQGSL